MSILGVGQTITFTRGRRRRRAQRTMIVRYRYYRIVIIVRAHTTHIRVSLSFSGHGSARTNVTRARARACVDRIIIGRTPSYPHTHTHIIIDCPVKKAIRKCHPKPSAARTVIMRFGKRVNAICNIRHTCGVWDGGCGGASIPFWFRGDVSASSMGDEEINHSIRSGHAIEYYGTRP